MSSANNNSQIASKNRFQSAENFRLKIVYSVLLNRAIEITSIRENEVNPGLTNSEVSFLKLISSITNGSKFEISKSGTSLKFFPGVITNNYGNEFDFECDPERNITYYLEGLAVIAYFGKDPLVINLIGVTNDDIDISVDCFKTNICPNLQKLVVGDNISLEIVKRGVKPIGKGKVKFKCPIVTHINPIDWTSQGRVKKVYGTAFSTRNSLLTRNIVESGKAVMLKFLPNVWIYEDKQKYTAGEEKSSPGFGLSMTAETNTGCFYSADVVYDKEKDLNAEELSKKCCLMLLDESGVVDTHSQALFLMFMAVSTNLGISRIKLGRISNYTIGVLREIKKLFGVKFKIEESKEEEGEEENEEEEINEEEEEFNEEDQENSDQEDEQLDQMINDSNALANANKVIFSCVGIGLRNVARKEI